MSFRLRLTVATAVAVAAAVAAASALVYLLVRSELRGQLDDALRERAVALMHEPIAIATNPRTEELVLDLREPESGFGPADVLVQAAAADGRVARPSTEQVAFPVSNATREAARGERGQFFSDATVMGTRVRMLTVPLRPGFALQLVRPLNEIGGALRRVGLILVFVALGGIGVAAALGALVARAALAPVLRLTRQTEVVAETQDLAHRIDLHGRDELSRLGASFNTMLAALEESQQAQRQLVADASHELRTPLTSLRTNVEVLARRRDLADAKREELLRDVIGQLEEMSLLVTNLVELASDQPADVELTDTQLDTLAQEAIGRAQRLAPQISFNADLEESIVRAVPGRLERAIANLLDNAVKWSQPGDEIAVRVTRGEVAVRDHGPGIGDEDLPYVFNRFYRAVAARSMPGSGLGLTIVKQVAEEHGGTVTIERPEGGGTLVRLKLPEVVPSGGDGLR